MRQVSAFATLIFIVILGIGVGLAIAVHGVTKSMDSIWIGVIAFFIALFVSIAIKVANQWEIVPSTVVETMQLGGVAGLTALTMGLGQEHADKAKES